MIIYLLCLIITYITVVDPDLQVRGGGGGGGLVIQTLRKGGARSQKKNFSALQALACEV